MNISNNSTNLTLQYSLLNKLLPKVQGNISNPINSLFNEETAAKNHAKYFDENGEILNSSGKANRYIGAEWVIKHSQARVNYSIYNLCFLHSDKACVKEFIFFQ